MKFDTNHSFAEQMDKFDDGVTWRDQFHIPQNPDGEPIIYFCGNSLGLMPKSVRERMEFEMKEWEQRGVVAHERWEPYHESLTESTARMAGALPSEVVVMNALTVNIHLLLVSFFRPTSKRYKIVIERGAFPSDQYAVESQLRFHGLDPKDALIQLTPRKGEQCLHADDIESILREEGDSIALVFMGCVNYYTGQAFEMDRITAVGHEIGAVVGFDLAHGAGNLILNLHNWDVDFAAWCSYKYLCGGSGSPAGIFVHERHAENDGPRFAGWWGHDKIARFDMLPDFDPMPGAEGWQISNPPIFSMAALKSAMEIIDSAGMTALGKKSELLTRYLEFLLQELTPEVKILTPSDPRQRGCQLSLSIGAKGEKIVSEFRNQGVICDWRKPDVIRVAPKPLYNTFSEVRDFMEQLKTMLESN